MSPIDIAVILVIVLCLAGVVWYNVKKHKAGKGGGCGCGCSGCSSASHCGTSHKK